MKLCLYGRDALARPSTISADNALSLVCGPT